MAGDHVEKSGTVVDIHPNSQYKVDLGNGETAIGHLCGKMKQNNINVLPGDEVIIHLSVYDTNRGIIKKRIEKED